MSPSPAKPSLNGINLKNYNGPIRLSTDDLADVEMGTELGLDRVTHLKIRMGFGAIGWTVYNKDTDGVSVGRVVNVERYARYGVGLYRVRGVATLKDGRQCSGSVLVRVEGNPLTTAAGAGAGAATAVGAAGVAAASARAARRDACAQTGEAWLCSWFIRPALLLASVAMVTGGPGGAPLPPAPAARAPRARWRPVFSVLGIVGGLLAGAGVVVLLQQYAVLYPTLGIAIAGLVAGVAVGIILPSLTRIIGVRRVNRRLEREERLARTEPGA